MSRIENTTLWVRQGLVVLICCVMWSQAMAGGFITARPSNEDIVTHPIGYTGTGREIVLDVCINPSSPTPTQTPVRNAIDRFNLLVPTVGNIKSGVGLPGGGVVDFESVLVHEMGHCIGLDHVNLASESGLEDIDQDYTKSTMGRNLSFQTGVGSDGVRGSPDDLRGDDENLHYFFVDENNPFTLPAQPDISNYSRDLDDLPTGDRFAANGDRQVSGLSRYGLSQPTEAVMQQGTFANEVQRALTADGVATLLYARTGRDHVAGNSDDYTVRLNYRGFSTANTCELQIEFEPDTFAFCEINTARINSDNERLTFARLVFDQDTNWAYETRRIPLPAVDTAELRTAGSVSIVNGGDTSLADNDTAQASGSLVTTTQSVFGPEHGTVTIESDGEFTYTHNGNDASNDRFAYEVCSGNNTFSCAQQFVNIAITPNQAPTAVTDAISVDEGGTATQLLGGATSVLDNDTEPEGDDLSVNDVTTQPQFASAFSMNLPSGTFSYTHDGSQNLSDSFVYEVCDNFSPSACSEATVSITITNVNDAPVIDGPDPVTVTVSEDGMPQAFALDLDANDDDGDTLSWSTPAITVNGGSASVDADGIVSYTPTADYFGADALVVTVSDGVSDNTVNVDITVEPVNDAPTFTASDPPPTTTSALEQTIDGWIESASAGPTNESGQTLSYQLRNVQDPDNILRGFPAINTAGTLTYTPSGNAGSATFEVQAVDSGGAANGGVDRSPSASFTIVVNLDLPPQFVASGPFTVLSNLEPGQFAADIDANNGDGGPNDGNVTYQLIGGTGEALFNIDFSTGRLTAAGDLGGEIGQTFTLDVEATDDSTQTTVATVSITVVEAPLFADGFES